MNEPSPSPLKLIVIEDSVDDYTLLMARLAREGRRVEAVRVETRAGLEQALARQRWDAVISDHRLPRFTSLEALAVVRAHDRELPFLIVSGAIGEEVAVEAMRAGADDYLMKDNLGRLEPALARAIESAAARRRQRAAEHALFESESRFRALTGNLPGMVFQLHQTAAGFRVAYVSEGAQRLFGIPPEALVAQPERWLATLPRADRVSLGRALRMAGADGRDLHWIGRVGAGAGAAAGTEHSRWIEVSASARAAGPAMTAWDGIVADITPQKLAEAELHASREELRTLATHLTRIREQEREAIARDIHDDVGSTLTAIKFELASLRNAPQRDAQRAPLLARVDQLLDNAILSSTRIMHDLRPGILDEGVVAALEWQARSFEQRMRIACQFASSHDEIPLTPDQAIAVFRICQEALNNVAKYASAKTVRIRLRAGAGHLVMDIGDDGIGIRPHDLNRPDRFGLRSMRERAHSLGGSVEIRGTPGQGTTISMSLPLASPSIAGPVTARDRDFIS
ncbi:MAG: ATP-binding protein [Casimicrobiaceae bacterium]